MNKFMVNNLQTEDIIGDGELHENLIPKVIPEEKSKDIKNMKKIGYL